MFRGVFDVLTALIANGGNEFKALWAFSKSRRELPRILEVGRWSEMLFPLAPEYSALNYVFLVLLSFKVARGNFSKEQKRVNV